MTVKSWSNAAPGGLRPDGDDRARRDERARDLRAAVHQHAGRQPEARPDLARERAVGVRIPINTATGFRARSRWRRCPTDPTLSAALAKYEGASGTEQASWDAAYEKVVANATFSDGQLVVKNGPYGPSACSSPTSSRWPARGALDGALLATPQLYATDYTRPLLFIADGTYMADLAARAICQGDQWGMMNETGNYPGQAWLWLYTLWYQVPPMNTSSNGDVEVWAIMMALTLFLALVPFIPVLRSIPRWLGIYRLIWRQHYRSLGPEILSQLPPGRQPSGR